MAGYNWPESCLENWKGRVLFMLMSNETASRLYLSLHCLGQEAAFGHDPKLSPEVDGLIDIPFEELTEEQAQLVIADAQEQRRKMFEVEATWQ